VATDPYQAIVALLVALGIPGVIYLFARGVYQWITGRAGRERARNSDYLARSIRDAERAEEEASKRRKTQEYASELRRQAIENGYAPIDWPADIEHTLSGPEARKLRKKRTTDGRPEADHSG
jgi:hypothetical protein